jgi:hypothetical protein
VYVIIVTFSKPDDVLVVGPFDSLHHANEGMIRERGRRSNDDATSIVRHFLHTPAPALE